MKNLFSLKKTKSLTWLLGASLSALTIVSCSNEETLDIEEGELLESTNSSFVTPQNGKIYTIRNRKSGRYLDIKNKSNSNGANLQQWGTSASSSDTHRQWEVINVGNGYVRLKGVDSGKSLEVKGGSNSNGANVEQRSYDNKSHQQWQILATSNGYFRIKGRDSGKSMGVKNGATNNGANIEVRSWNGNNKFQWFFTEVGSSGGGGTATPPTNGGGSGSAAAIIGGMGSRWKLNAFSGSLNIGSGSYGRSGANGLTYQDRANTSDNNNWFFDTNGYAAFKCHVGNPSSNNSGNMRSELRELDGSGDEIEWDGTTGTNHRMRYKVQIRRMPTSGKLCFGQIHGSGSFDDVIRLQIDDSNANRGATSGKTTGTYDVQIKGYVTEELDRDNRNKSWARIQMRKEYDVEIAMRNKKVTVKLDGNTIYTSKDVNSKDNYFKAGAYLQSSQFDKTPQLKRNNNNFGEVWIKNLVINH